MTFLLEDGMVLCGFFLLSYSMSYFAIPFIIKAAKNRRLVDHPDDSRKIHSEAVPTLGGIAIFIAFLVSYSISPWSDSLPGFSYFIASLLILFFIGLKDDLIALSAHKKLIAQIIAGLLVIFGSGIRITDFQGVFGLTELPYWLTILTTLFTIIVVINAVNLIDGIDGLAGGIGTLASLFLGVGFLTAGQWPMAAFSFCLTGALLGFLWHNFSPASIFMGDTGSMLLGFLLAVQAVAFLEMDTYSGYYEFFDNAIPVLTVSILAFPLFDTLRVVIKRCFRGHSIFTAGQDHIHHELLRMGFSHGATSILLYVMNIVLIVSVAALALTDLNINLILGALILACLFIYPTNGFKRSMFSRLFGYKWQRLYSWKWDLHFDQRDVISLRKESRSEEENEEEEIDKVAV